MLVKDIIIDNWRLFMNTENFKMNNLKKLREKKNLTQIRLSIDVEVSQELISQYELGKTKPNADNLIKLADYFNCSTDYLLERTNNPFMISDINNKDIETANISEKYNSLSAENKKHFLSYLDYLSKNTK
jgi:transcriptional regulator with XRE-family HTH domain